MAASCSGHPDIVQLLLDNGVNVNSQNSGLWTALHLPSTNGHSDVVE